MALKTNDTKTAILLIAKELMKQVGYNAFSYADIAKQLNIKNAAIHYHFPAKEDLLSGVIDTYIDDYILLDKQLRLSGLTPTIKLKKFIERYAQLIQQKNICIIGSVASDYNTLPLSVKEKVTDLVKMVLNMVEKTLKDGKTSGEFIFSESPKIKSLLIMTNLAAGVQLARITGPEDFKIIEDGIQNQLKG